MFFTSRFVLCFVVVLLFCRYCVNAAALSFEPSPEEGDESKRGLGAHLFHSIAKRLRRKKNMEEEAQLPPAAA